MFNLFYIVQIPFMYGLPGNIQYSTLFHISQIGSNWKSQTQYGIPWNPESDANNIIIVLIHICLSPINRIGTSRRNGNSPIWLMINVKRKRKKEEGSLLGMKLCYLDFFSQKIERWIDIVFYWIWIRRDWRGSNPQLPPWQGGALTNWTTIPSKYHNKIKYTYFYDFILTLSISIRIGVL